MHCYGQTDSKILIYNFQNRNRPSQMFYKIGVLKNVTKKLRKSHRKIPVFESLFNKTLLKRDSNTGVFLWNLQNF